MDWVTWLNTGVGVIGIVVGIIGWRSIQAATEINYSVKAGEGSTIHQGGTYNYGVGDDTVRLITKDMTREEMCRLMIKLIPVNTDDDNCIAKRLAVGDVKADDFEKVMSELPTIYYGAKAPLAHKDGNIWIRLEQ